MTEDFLYYLWQYHLPGKTLTGTAGEEITLVHPGTRNTDSGPDFFNSKVKINNTLWAGNVEIHVHSSHWYNHGHQTDPHYDSIILHAVYQYDRPVYRSNGEPIPTLELRGKFPSQLFETYRGFLLSKQWIPCQEHISRAGHFHILNWLYRLAMERLQRKATQIENLLRKSQLDFREVFYRQLLQNYGFKTNGEAFAQLGHRLPYALLAKHKDNLRQIEALLFGQAGLLPENPHDAYAKQLRNEYLFLSRKYNLQPLDGSIWKFMRMHPSNFPTIRLAQFAALFYRSSSLLQQMLEARRLNDVLALLQTEASGYWKSHYRFNKTSRPVTKRMGKTSLHLLLINTLVPFLLVYGSLTENPQLREKALDWLSLLPAENNGIIRHFEQLGIKAENAMHSQALIELKTRYCDRRQCLHCAIGHALLKQL